MNLDKLCNITTLLGIIYAMYVLYTFCGNFIYVVCIYKTNGLVTKYTVTNYNDLLEENQANFKYATQFPYFLRPLFVESKLRTNKRGIHY